MCLTLGEAVHELHIRLKPPRAAGMAQSVEMVQVRSAPHTHVPPHTHLTACGALWHRHRHLLLVKGRPHFSFTCTKTQVHCARGSCVVSHLCILSAPRSLSARLDSWFHTCPGTGSDPDDNVCRSFHWNRKRSPPCTLQVKGNYTDTLYACSLFSALSGFKGKAHPKMKKCSPSCRWRVVWSFVVWKTFLELHSQTTMQHSFPFLGELFL